MIKLSLLLVLLSCGPKYVVKEESEVFELVPTYFTDKKGRTLGCFGPFEIHVFQEEIEECRKGKR